MLYIAEGDDYTITRWYDQAPTSVDDQDLEVIIDSLEGSNDDRMLTTSTRQLSVGATAWEYLNQLRGDNE